MTITCYRAILIPTPILQSTVLLERFAAKGVLGTTNGWRIVVAI